jgi:LysM repeat protein
MIKTIVLSLSVATTVIVTGCASKPQYKGGARYVNAPNYYTVRSGDTLSGIANRYGLNYLDIAALNDIAAPYRIYVNQSLRLKGSVVSVLHRRRRSLKQLLFNVKRLIYRLNSQLYQKHLLLRQHLSIHQLLQL